MSDRNNKTDTDRMVDEILKSDPGYTLPDDFADRLSHRFEKHFSWNLYFNEFLIYLATIAGIIFTAVAMAYFLMSELWGEWLKAFFNHWEEVAGIVILLTFILFADRVLLRYFSYRVNKKTVNQ